MGVQVADDAGHVANRGTGYISFYAASWLGSRRSLLSIASDPMLTRRYFLALLPSVFFLPGQKPAIGTEEDSALGDFDEANAPLEPYGDLDMAAWRPIDILPQLAP